MAIRLKANRRSPSIPVVTDDTGNHTQVLMAIREALDIGQRRTNDILNSFVRLQDLVDLGIIDAEGNIVIEVEGGGASTLDDLADVDLSTPPVSGDVLKYDGTSWVAGDAAASYLDDLLNVDAPYPAIGDVLSWDGSEWVNAPSVTDALTTIGLFHPGVPTSSKILMQFTAPEAWTLPGDMDGSYGHIGTNPTSEFEAELNVNDSPVGTVTISTTGEFAFATTGAVPVDIAAGDKITLVAPSSVDASAADISVTFAVEAASVVLASKLALGFFFPGTPGSSQLIGKMVVAHDATFPANFSSSYGDVGTNPTSSFEVTLSVNGADAGTITVSTGGVFTFASTNGEAINVAPGDIVEAEAQASIDATLADISFTLVAELT